MNIDDLVHIIEKFCRQSNGEYTCKDCGVVERDERLVKLNAIVKLDGKKDKAEVHLALSPSSNAIRIVVPIFDQGVIGKIENVGQFYMNVTDLDMRIFGNAKIGPYPYDNSARLVITLTDSLDRVSLQWLQTNMKYLIDVLVTRRPILLHLINALNLEFSPEARLSDGYREVIALLKRNMPSLPE